MRPTIALSLIVLTGLPAMAQQQPQQQANPPQQMVDAYGYPAYVPQQAPQPQYYAPQPQPQQQAPVYNQPRPGEYGHSVINDIRQMNF